MDASDILNALDIGEDSDWEFKSARGGLPGSMWETYSAMANTDGGTIVLGVENDGEVSGLPDPGKTKKSFWDTVNNRGKVSTNLLTDESAQIVDVEGRSVLIVSVPRADRRHRPVYVGQNPLIGTYRRNYEGDYRCTEDEVGRMLADRADEPADSRILEHFGLDDLDLPSLNRYRQRFSARAPDHPWLSEKPRGFLQRLGGWRKDRATGQEGVTVAGLVMFGKDEAIRDPRGIPQFHLDYREKLSDSPEVRWTDRLTFDGTWTCNVFQFYQRVMQRLTSDLKLPFQMEPDLFRKDETVVHEAIREAVVNAFIHADYLGQGGVLIEKYRNRFELSNPGTLLLSFEQILAGGISECRNKSLQKMFFMIGGGEQAGSGIDKIRQGWRSQRWRSPSLQTTLRPDRVRLVMPMISLLPEDSLKRLRNRFGSRFDHLKAPEVQALVTAEVEGQVCNSRLKEIAEEHPADITRMLQGLVNRRFLEQHGQKRGSTYCLPESGSESVSSTPAKEGTPLLSTPDSSHKPGDSLHNGADSSHTVSPETDPALMEIAAASRQKKRLPPEESEKIILRLCSGRFLTVRQISSLLDRQPDPIRNRFLTPMVGRGDLRLRYPAEPNRPDQAYTSHITDDAT